MIDRSRQRVAVVGIDGFSVLHLKRYMRDGAMPALSGLAERGIGLPLISTLPATTPVAWTAMSTGCYPSTNGIEGFLLHRPGRAFDDRLNGVYADRVQAEPLWQTATLNGLASFVVKFPVSYPSATATLRVDGAAGWGGITCLHEVVASGTSVWPQDLRQVHPNAADAAESGRARPAVISQGARWTGDPPSGHEPRWFGTLTLLSIWGRANVVLHLAICDDAGAAILAIAEDPAWTRTCALVPTGSWSAPLLLEAENRRGDVRPCAIRFKPMQIECEPVHLRLFNTPLHELDGHSAPDARWQRHRERAGPIEEQTDPTPLFSGAIDMATHVDRCRLNTDWLGRVSKSILETEPWDLFMVQTHIVDWAHHVLHGAIDPRHPLHDPARAQEADALLRLFYSMADELVASVVDAAGEAANIVVMGDHGQDLHHTTVRFNEWLAKRGDLVFRDSSGPAIDWSRTRACALGNGIYLNLKDRDPQGIVDSSDYASLVEDLCQDMRRLSDPRTQMPVVRIAGPRCDFAYLGGHGRGTGDVVFVFESGYQARNDRGPLFELTKPWREFTSGHDHFWPLDPALETHLFAAGPAFTTTGSGRSRPIVDVAPTLAAVLGIDPPDGIDGVAIADILADRSSATPVDSASFQPQRV